MSNISGQSIIEIDNQLRQMPEYKLVEEIRSFSRSLQLFDGNYRELKERLEFFEDAQRSIYLDQAGNELQKQHFYSEVIRLVHNYVAAAFSLVDHSRRHYRKLYSINSFPEYVERVKLTFADDPLSNFMKGLRNHFQHYGLPFMYFQTSWNRAQPEIKRTIHLSNDALKEFDWDLRSLEYLNSQVNDINLTTLIDTYQKKVMEFYEWFQSRQEQIHDAEFKKVEGIKAKMRRLALPDILNATLQFPNIDRANFEGSILRFLSNDEQIVFALMETDSKAEFLLIVFKAMADISPAIEKRIRELYSTP
jgi:hypothetical protein